MQNKPKILIFGSSGMLGHLLLDYLISLDEFLVFDCSKSPARSETLIIDIFNIESVKKILLDIQPDIVINCIGLLVAASSQSPAKAIFVNGYFPHFLKEFGEKKYKLIHISTDCVFSGSRGNYKEDDYPDAKDYYGKSKAIGEIIDETNLTIRTSIIGPEIKNDGTGLFDWIFKQKGTINGYANAIWSGVTTLELSKAIYQAIISNVVGLYHLTSPKPINKFDLLTLINELWNLGLNINKDEKIKVNKSLVCTRTDFSYNVKEYREMLLDLKKWMETHKNRYKKYFE